MTYKKVKTVKQLLLVDPRKNGFVSTCNLVEQRRKKSLVTYNVINQCREMGFSQQTDEMSCSWVPNKYLFEMEVDENQRN